MAAGAYAALLSLMHTLEMIMLPSQQLLRIERVQIESLLEKVRSLQEFFEDYSHKCHEETAALGSRIVDMTRAADSVIDYHMLDQILSRYKGKEAQSSASFGEYIQSVTKEMEDLIETEVTRIQDQTTGASRPLRDFSPAGSARLAPKDHNTLVGSDKKLVDILDTLTGDQPNREIIAIVGMGGIGKTALAKNVYKNDYTVQYFHIRAWATVSQDYSAREIISEMLSEIDRSRQECVPGEDQFHGELYKRKQERDLSEYGLGDRLYKILFDRRYLIVMDDLWSIEAWEKIRAFLPDDCNGSRIIVTTRELNVARELGSCMSLEMDLLGDDQSWMLLRDKVFGKEGCPPELEELGKAIANKCRGLPLAVVAIGGLLAKSNRTREVLEDALENLNSIISSGDEGNCMEILKLSYNNLPIHLKPCFLYIAVSSKYRRAMLPELSWVLVGEGLIKPVRDRSLEEVAKEYIKDLIDRNLVVVHEFGRIGEIKLTGMHDFLGDLCMKQVEEEKFLSVVIDEHNLNISTAARPLGILREASQIRSTTRVYASRLVVWNGLEAVEPSSSAEEEITQLPFLRLCFLNRQNLSSLRRRFIDSIPFFWCLQSLIVTSSPGNPVVLPSEIWDLPQLRHIFANVVFLCDPIPPHYRHDGRDPHVLETLQTLVGVLDFRCGEEVYKRAPNVKILKVVYGPQYSPEQWDAIFGLPNLVHLHKLEVLKFHSMSPISLNHLSFPPSLKKLTLIGCHLPWKDMTTIVGYLPNLEELGLHDCEFEGRMWRLVDEEFLALKRLGIDESRLVHWKADRTHFPILEDLSLGSLNLEEFPEDFGELPTLRRIKVLYCGDSTNGWAEQVGEEQESLGNEDFQVIVIRRREDD
ncbi:hypothetical protein F511_35874 [Dorcoceras hygrometricum]|uniref:Uncharacterized protein n=1 Tax=Dorcoceras hygrometricum TaxID=472368 RepID=A0A2Z7BLJ1_9LAMI|nr:hypothetical protein F511_35874 [Dorcoceras hygrometricum]